MHSGLSQLRRNLIQQLAFEEGIIRIFVIERDSSFIREKDLPFGETDGIVWIGRFGKESLREGFWEGATGDGNFEDFVALDAGVLGVDYVGSEGGREGVDGGEGEEVGLFTHCDDVVGCNQLGEMILIWMKGG